MQQLGYIATDTLRGLLKEIDDKLTKEDLDQAIDEIDADGSGKIEFEGIKTDILTTNIDL